MSRAGYFLCPSMSSNVLPMSSAAHTITYVTHSNGAPAKGRRYSCSCGSLGGRFAFFPFDKDSKAKAQAKAEKDAADHLAGGH